MLFLSLLLLLTLHLSNPLSTKLAPRAISTPRSLAIQHLSRTNCTTTTPPPPPHFSALDTSFLHLLTTTVHRNTPRLLLTLSSFYTRPPKKARAPVTAALLLGAAQLLILKTPPHAAVGETIAALKQVRPPVNQQTINFVNAVLRRVSKEGEAVFGTLEATVNVGDYLKEKVIADWGEGVGGAVLAEMTADRTVGISITCKDSKVTSAAFDGLTPAIPNQITTSGAVILRQVGVGSIPSLPGYSDGSWWVQDPAAALVVKVFETSALLQALSAGTVPRVADVCAFPGGKTAQLCQLGYDVVAVDVSASRKGRFDDNMKRLNFEPKVVVADAGSADFDLPGSLHGMVVDAPCSATGVGRKRPDVLQYTPREGLLETQKNVAKNCIQLMKKKGGGVVVYSVCSLLKEEGEDVVDYLLANLTGVTLDPVLVGTVGWEFDDAIDSRGCVRVLPGVQGGVEGEWWGDGFFVARLIIEPE